MFAKIKAFLERFHVSFSAQALLYPVFFVGALVFAQRYKMAVSHTVFVFVALLPIGVVLQLLLARLFIRAALRVSERTVEKRRSVSFMASVANKSPIPFPFVEAVLMLPDERGVKIEARRFIMSILPFSVCRIERSMGFAFRGDYTVGFSCVYVYDLSHSVRLRIDLDDTQRIFVLPRRLSILSNNDPTQSESTVHSPVSTRVHGTEMSDTRLYEHGDCLKRIHWKLSSKSEDIIVKDSLQNGASRVCVMCDFEPHYQNSQSNTSGFIPRPDTRDIIDYIGADAAVEIAVAVVLRELKCGSTVTLAWIENGDVAAVELDSLNAFEAIFRRFTAAPLDKARGHIAKIQKTLEIRQDTKAIIVCPYLAFDTAKEYVSLFSGEMGHARHELFLCLDEKAYLPIKSTKAVEECLSTLTLGGIDAKRINL